MKVLITRTFMILIYLKLYGCDLLKLYSYDGNIIRHSKIKHILYNSNSYYQRKTKENAHSKPNLESANVTKDINYEMLQSSNFYDTKSTIRVERSSPEFDETGRRTLPEVTTEMSGGNAGGVQSRSSSGDGSDIVSESQVKDNLTSQILELKSDLYNLYQLNNNKSGGDISDRHRGSSVGGKNISSLESEDLDDGGVRVKHPKDDAELIGFPELDENISGQSEREDIVSYFLKKVESQHTLGGNCEAGTELNLGEGVVDRYAQERFRVEADVAVNRANMLTRLWKYAPAHVMESEYLLHAGVISMVEFDDDIFAAGNCYDENQYKGYRLFCPYAYRLPEGPILAKDLAVEYKYLSNTSEWFYIARKNAENVIRKNNQFRKAYNTYTHKVNSTITTHTQREQDDILIVTYEDGKWSKPYYDCGGGNIWMLTYTVPFFGFGNNTYFFKGTSGIDIDLRRVDIDQCPLPPDSNHFNIFAASDKCKKRTTECVSVPGLGFRRGSYKCLCKKRFYFPDTKAPARYFNGTVIEEEYEKLMMNEDNDYNKSGIFECLPCAEGCESCRDGRPCVVSLNWMLRMGILILSCAVICCLPAVIFFTWKYRNVKVIRAASPVLLRVIALGAFFIYATTIVMYPVPNVITCSARVWLREVGFMLIYGALMLKTWRISVIFRVRSAKAIKITDMDLLKRLGMMLATFSILLLIRTLVAPPTVIVGRTAEDLKAYLCSTDWWDHSFSILEVLFLIWGIRLCIVVRKAPSEFNESRFISMAIYNEFLLSVFLNVSMLFLQSPANPDLLYIIFFCHTQLTVTLLLCLIFGSKAYMVLKGHGKTDDNSSVTAKSQAARFISKPRSTNHSQSQASNNACTAYILEYSNISDHDIQEEFRRLYKQLGKLRDENMRQGNRHLAARISAMQEAGRQGYADDDILEAEESSDCIMATELYVVNKKSESVEVQVNSEDIALTKSNVASIETSGGEGVNPANSLNASNASSNGGGNHSNVVKSSIEDVSGSSEQSSSKTIKPKAKVKTKTKCSRKLLHKKLGNSKSTTEVTTSTADSANAQTPSAAAAAGAVPPSSTTTDDSSTGPNSPNNCSKSSNLKSGHAKTHAIVINLDDKNRFTEEVTV